MALEKLHVLMCRFGAVNEGGYGNNSIITVVFRFLFNQRR